MHIECLPVKTRPIIPPQDDIYSVIETSLPPLQEKDVIVVTSKIVAIHQGRCVKIRDDIDKDTLIQKEAESIIPRRDVPYGAAVLTIKEHTLIPTAGIDESNANGYYILWPKESSIFAKQLCVLLRNKYRLKNIAVIVTDSHSIPMRLGVLGCSIGFYGLEPLNDYRGKKDIFGRELSMTQQNVVDTLAVLSVAVMGEGNEQTPLAIIRGANFVQFTEEDTYEKFVIPKEKDIYRPMLDRFKSTR